MAFDADRADDPPKVEAAPVEALAVFERSCTVDDTDRSFSFGGKRPLTPLSSSDKSSASSSDVLDLAPLVNVVLGSADAGYQGKE